MRSARKYKKILPYLIIILVATLVIIPAAIFPVYQVNSFKSPFEKQEELPASLSSRIFPAQFSDKNLFLSAIKQSKTLPLNQKISGLSVPHHLLARDIIADVFASAANNKYERIIIVSPDHYSLGRTRISYATQNFSTPFGLLLSDQDFIKKLATVSNASSSDFFYREHGIGAELPYIKYYFPNAKIVAITLSTSAHQKDLNELISFLEKNIGPETLIVQSTDFSHYLNSNQAGEKDKETISLLNKIENGEDPQIIFSLNEPNNIDCLACQYLQTKIQKDVYKSKIHIIDHKNSQDYTSEVVEKTTSYIPQIYY